MELLSASPAGYELARALTALGTESRDTELLARAVAMARECGADGLVARATEALLRLGGAPPRGSDWQGALTEEERRLAERARDGDPMRTEPERSLLSAVCRKLGTDLTGLAEALNASAASAASAAVSRA
ncbi:hypothetical protein ACFQL8_38195 [Streptomyces goshikiensis]|uniref:hypothetical protein n=1 Tax=Streptomyces goshikiensis TaxID=1942 RepID=UPI00360B5340